MRTEQFRGHTVKIYEDVDEMPIRRFQRFNKCLLYDMGIGSDFSDVDVHMARIASYIPKDPAKALQELENMRNNLYYIVQGVSPRHMAFAALVAEVDGWPRDDLSDEGLNETLALLDDVKHTVISRLAEAIKKKISEDLSVYFPATFNDVHEKDATERIIRRTRLVLSEITTEQDASEDIGRIGTQQAFLKAVAKQLLQIGNVKNIPALVDIFYTYVKTDLTTGNLVWLGNEALNIGTENIHFATLPGDGSGYYNKQSVYVLDAQATCDLVNEALNPYNEALTLEDMDILVP